MTQKSAPDFSDITISPQEGHSLRPDWVLAETQKIAAFDALAPFFTGREILIRNVPSTKVAELRKRYRDLGLIVN
jgi:hypothetical protein